jgi:hypothetical protein
MVMKAIMPQHDRTTFHNQSSSFVYQSHFVRCFFCGPARCRNSARTCALFKCEKPLEANASEGGVQTGQILVWFSKRCYMRDILQK